MTSKNDERNIATWLSSIQENRKKEEKKKEELNMEGSSYTFFAFFIIISALIFQLGIMGVKDNQSFRLIAFLSGMSILIGLIGFVLSRKVICDKINKVTLSPGFVSRHPMLKWIYDKINILDHDTSREVIVSYIKIGMCILISISVVLIYITV